MCCMSFSLTFEGQALKLCFTQTLSFYYQTVSPCRLERLLQKKKKSCKYFFARNSSFGWPGFMLVACILMVHFNSKVFRKKMHENVEMSQNHCSDTIHVAFLPLHGVIMSSTTVVYVALHTTHCVETISAQHASGCYITLLTEFMYILLLCF